MYGVRSILNTMFIAGGVSLVAATAGAAVKGDINDDSKIDLIESIYALRVVSQSTGAMFTADDLTGKTFYEVQPNSSGGQICIIEALYSADTVHAKEWQYINDDSWLPGCLEEYVPNEEADMSYTIENGAISLILGPGETWVTNLVARFDDNLLVSTIDGTAMWSPSKERINELVDPKFKFTQEILSANPWYIVETYPEDPDNPDCNGKFVFDGNITLTVSWDDSGTGGSQDAVYFNLNGSVSMNHDQKNETETISTYSADQITTVKTVLRDDGSTDGSGTVKYWFKNKADAEAFLTSNSRPLCYPAETPAVTSSTGRVWMDRNLGASRVATSSTDAEAYGDLYQWGRGTDGHEKRTSDTTTDLSTSDTPGHGNFITVATDPNDWRTPQNDNLWQGVTGINNPCPDGFRLPTSTEQESEKASWSSDDADGAFGSPLKLVVGGWRRGLLSDVGDFGHYWSSTTIGAYAVYMEFFRDDDTWSAGGSRGNGFSVRCIQD